MMPASRLVSLAAALGLAATTFLSPAAPAAAAAGGPETITTAVRTADSSPRLTPAERDLVSDLRRATRDYRDVREARRAGFVRQGRCVEAKDRRGRVVGASGIRYVKWSRVDRNIQRNYPEALVYLPGRRGDLELVAVLYLSTERGESLVGHRFDRGPLHGGSSLHVWVWKANSAGMFAPYNPGLRCPGGTT